MGKNPSKPAAAVALKRLKMIILDSQKSTEKCAAANKEWIKGLEAHILFSFTFNFFFIWCFYYHTNFFLVCFAFELDESSLELSMLFFKSFLVSYHSLTHFKLDSLSLLE